jgi:PAS domain S-box-containing protein
LRRRYTIVMQDSTDQKRIEKALHDSEARWHALAEAMPQLVWTCTADGRCDYLSRQWVEYTGKPEAEQLGYGWLEQVHSDDSENLIAAWLRTIQSGEQFEAELRIRRADGIWRWFIARATPLRDAEGCIVKWYGSSSDIDDLKRAENDLARERAVLAGIINSTDVMLVYLDRGFNFVWVNPAYAETCRMSPVEMIGKNHFVLYPHAENESIFRRVRDTGIPVFYKDKPFEFPDQPERGVTYWDWSLMPITEPERRDRVIGLVFTLRETTRYKQAELALQEADRRKDEFLAMLAHELRNPLTPIRNAAHVLGQPGLDEPRITWARDIIERHVSHLTRLVDDLVDLSLIVQGRIVLKREQVELTAMIDQALEATRPLMEARGHRCEIRLPPQPIWLEGDPVRLAQVLINLMDNAAKYSPDGGHVEITAGTAGREAEIRVRDRGIGIPAQLLPHIFELFRQGERNLDRSQGGMGIGLTMVRRLIELHDGRVAVESAGPGQGATFILHLPLCEPPAAHPDEIPAPRPARLSVRVLVVDDDPAVADSTALLLELNGYRVRIAYSGEDAIEQARGFLPQIVLFDIGMRGIDGYETAVRMRELPGGRTMHLVAVTGYGDEQTQQRSRDAGIDYHMVKPVNPNELCTLLDTVVAEYQSPRDPA